MSLSGNNFPAFSNILIPEFFSPFTYTFLVLPPLPPSVLQHSITEHCCSSGLNPLWGACSQGVRSHSHHIAYVYFKDYDCKVWELRALT